VTSSEENTLKHPLRVSLVGATLVGLVSLLVHPFGAAKADTSASPLLAGAEVDPRASEER
jgi:hypothetical protein